MLEEGQSRWEAGNLDSAGFNVAAEKKTSFAQPAETMALGVGRGTLAPTADEEG